MKPVLRKAIDKNGAAEIIFTPTAQMILFSCIRGDNPRLTDNEVCEKCSISKGSANLWRSKYGFHFEEWLEQATDFSVTDEAKVLDRFGMMQALQPGNFQYWRECARTRGVIKEEPKNLSITVNTDFKAILLAVGGDFEQARAKLLERASGVVLPRGPGMAGPPQQRLEGLPSSEGVGISPMQRGSMAMDDSLGADRGCAEPRKSFPAISQQGTPLHPDSILDIGEISPSSKE